MALTPEPEIAASASSAELPEVTPPPESVDPKP